MGPKTRKDSESVVRKIIRKLGANSILKKNSDSF